MVVLSFALALVLSVMVEVPVGKVGFQHKYANNQTRDFSLKPFYWGPHPERSDSKRLKMRMSQHGKLKTGILKITPPKNPIHIYKFRSKINLIKMFVNNRIKMEFFIHWIRSNTNIRGTYIKLEAVFDQNMVLFN